jgi:hypothetical protein
VDLELGPFNLAQLRSYLQEKVVAPV